MFKRFLSFLKGYRILTIMTPVMVFLDVVIELQIPKIMGELITMLYSTENPDFAHDVLNMKLLEMLGLCALTLLVGYIASRCSAIASMGFSANMRSALFNKIQDFSFENIDKLKVSSLITRMTSDTSRISSVFSNIIVTFVRGPFLLILALKYSLEISRDLSKIFIFCVPAIIVLLVILGFAAVPLFRKLLKVTDDFNGTLRSNINGIRVVKSFVREDYEKEKFEKVNDALVQTSIRAQKIVLYIAPLLMVVIYGCMVAALFLGSKIVISDTLAGISGGLEVGQITTFTSYISQVLSSLMTILMVFVTIATAKASVERLGEVFDQVPTVTDDEGDENTLVDDGSVEFRNVSFKYESEAVKNVLENINLKIKSGETIGIIGSTGSAKSTLVQLVPRLYDATEGEVFVGGHNVKEYKFQNLRKEVAIVPQQHFLFSGTIKDNLLWGDLSASDEEVIEAAKAAQAHDFIMEKEKGYDTEVGQGGNTVSGGQRQRLCIARALLRKPKILILDDSTSAVDTATDAKIREALKGEKFKNITKIIIGQRITSIMNADRIIVLEDGRISGIGTHDELVKTNEVYNEIFVSQQEGVLAQ
ncbi:MAG: ABC transporter ATP-binding protein [Clostridia bacterium]|nr:ABC transporter ATP-binding protein [Clostridia bacterium]